MVENNASQDWSTSFFANIITLFHHDFFSTKKAVIFFVLLTFPFFSSAGLLIWPTNLVIEKGEKSTILWLENKGAQPKNMQLRTFKWSKENNENQLIEQNDVLVSPPMVKIEPGKKQMIRVLNQRAISSGKEYFYRLIIDELPLANGKKEIQGISFQMRYSVPLFIYGEGLNAGKFPENFASFFSWQIVKKGNKKLIEIRNNSPLHVYIQQAEIAKHKTTELGYLLPNSSVFWAINAPVENQKQLTITINDYNLPIKINR